MFRTIISDFLTQKFVWKYYKKYKKTQWYSKEEMNVLQINKLKSLLNHCYQNVPYYRKIIIENAIDITNISSVENIIKQFPVLTKEIIQDNYKDFTPNNNRRISGVLTKQTGGTTGNILFNRNDANTRSSVWATYKRYEDWMGHKGGDKTLRLMGGHVKKLSLKAKLKNAISKIVNNEISLDIYDTSNEIIEKVITILKTKNISHIRSYPQFLFSIGKQLEERELNFNIGSISTTAEPIMDEHRNLFKKVFNAQVYDQYGCGEIGGIAYECNHHNGLHIAEERVIVEVNESNELIITDLDNYTMPFIRYWNADQAILDKQLCSCGRKSTLIKKVMGRTCDYVTGINGEFLHWAYFWHLIFDSNVAKNHNLRKFQVIQNSINSILIKLVCDTLSEKEKEFIVTDIKKRIGKMEINFSYEDDIENSKTGKYRPIINKILENK